MEFVYVFIYGEEWEDISIFLSKEDAIKQSIKYPNHRVEIFSNTDSLGYKPTYFHYQNGEFIQNS